MFKNVTIRMAGPICTCKSEKLGWHIRFERGSGISLVIQCKLCDTSLIIPNEKFVANFDFDVQYPNGQHKDAQILKLVPEKDKK